MLYKNIEKEFTYILWLRKRIKELTFGIKYQVKTDSTTDFTLLINKLNSYQEEFNLVIDEFYSLLKNETLPTQINTIGTKSRTLSI